MKKILFSLENLQNLNMLYHGGGTYGINIIRLLLEDKNILESIIVFYNSKKIITKELNEILENDLIKKLDESSFQDTENFYDYINKNFDYIFTPIKEQKFSDSRIKIKTITPIHDMRFFEISPDISSLKLEKKIKDKIKKIFWILSKKYLINYFRNKDKPQKEDYIITVSEYSKYSILITYPYLDEKKIKVLNPLISKNIIEDNEKIANLNDNYFLLICGNRWEKNALKVIKAYDELLNDFKSIDKKMLIAGVKNINLNLKNKEKFKFVDYVSEKELQILYKNTYCFIYPTLNEGFGYPPLEVMRYSKPVIASAVTSIPEIYGNSVEYINPYSTYEIKNKILYLLNNKEHYNLLIQKSKDYMQQLLIKQKELREEYFNFFKMLVNS